MSRKIPNLKDMKPVVDYANEHGWSIEVAKNNHIQLYKEGRRRVTTSWSSGDRRSYMNCVSELRRMDRLAEDAFSVNMRPKHIQADMHA